MLTWLYTSPDHRQQWMRRLTTNVFTLFSSVWLFQPYDGTIDYTFVFTARCWQNAVLPWPVMESRTQMGWDGQAKDIQHKPPKIKVCADVIQTYTLGTYRYSEDCYSKDGYSERLLAVHMNIMCTLLGKHHVEVDACFLHCRTVLCQHPSDYKLLQRSGSMLQRSGVGGSEGSGGPGEFVISGCLDPHPLPPLRKNSHRIFTFCVDPLGSSGGSRLRL